MTALSELTVEDIALGIWLAHRLAMPFNEVPVADAIGDELDRELSADETGATLALMPDLEVVKAAMFLVRRSEIAVQAIGRDLGVIADHRVPMSATPRKIEMTGDGDTAVIGGHLEVRSSDGKSWHVVDLKGRGGAELLSWHRTAQAAKDWAVERLSTGPQIAKSAAEVRPFTEGPKS